MSNKVKSISKEMTKEASQPQVKTKDMLVRIDCRLYFEHGERNEKTTYMLITGIPEDLPAEYEGTVLKTAERQFAQALNSRLYMEFYNFGKGSKDERPFFINMSKLLSVEVIDVSKKENN